MWMICNGANKSGSTWIFQLYQKSRCFADLPPELQAEGWANQSVSNKLVSQAAGALGQSSQNYVTKQHWRSHYSFVLGLPGVKMVNIIRDIRDVIVSRYHHEIRVGGFDGSISRFIEEQASELVEIYCGYQDFWISSDKIAPDRYYITSYEHMRRNEELAANELFDFSGIDIPAPARAAAVKVCHFENRGKTGEKFFLRRAKVFGFVDEISESEQDAIMEVARKNGFLETKRKIADFNPIIAPVLAETDIGI